MVKKKSRGKKSRETVLDKAPDSAIANAMRELSLNADRVKKAVDGMMGRPTKYDKRFCRQLLEYFLGDLPYQRTMTMFGPKENPSDLPTLAGFAIKIGVHRDTIHEWAEGKDEAGKLKHPEFSDAIKKAKTVQEHYLVTNGLRGNYDRTFSIFFAKNVLGWKDVQHVVEQPIGYGDVEKPPKPKTVEQARQMAEEADELDEE
jgi:hypothetical protein